jgi:hypothetical protein
MVKKEKVDLRKVQASGSKIIESNDCWLSTNKNAVYINLDTDDLKRLPVEKYEYFDRLGNKVTGTRITLIASRQNLQELVNGTKRGVKLGLFLKGNSEE